MLLGLSPRPFPVSGKQLLGNHSEFVASYIQAREMNCIHFKIKQDFTFLSEYLSLSFKTHVITILFNFFILGITFSH